MRWYVSVEKRNHRRILRGESWKGPTIVRYSARIGFCRSSSLNLDDRHWLSVAAWKGAKQWKQSGFWALHHLPSVPSPLSFLRIVICVVEFMLRRGPPSCVINLWISHRACRVKRARKSCHLRRHRGPSFTGNVDSDTCSAINSGQEEKKRLIDSWRS